MGVTFNRSDLEFILTQIGYAEGGQQPVNPHLAFGLRQVDGQFNSVVDGQPLYGAAAQIFPRLTNPVFQSAGSQTSYASTSGFVVDATPRIISNLIADQTAANPAAVAAAAAANAQLGDGYQSTLPGPDGILGTKDDVVSNTSTPAPVAADGSLFINNVTPDAGLSAPFNSLFTLFGQFFDHGLDLTAKGGSGTVMIPLQPDDPLYKAGSPTNFMVLSRATNQPGADGVLGTADDVHANTNLVTPFVDQNQTYTSHPSHQVFLREYIRGVDGQIHSTGRLLEGVRADGSRGEPTWADIKANALLLGIRLNDTVDVTNIPLVKVDAYGNFIPDPVTGLAQLVTNLGADGKYGTDDDVVVHGARDANGIVTPVTTENALRIGTAFLNDIAASANPLDQTTNKFLIPASDGIINDAAHPLAAGTFDVDLLNQHFIAGDGRANENIGLTAIHEVFHDEHNRLVEQTKDLVRAELAKGDTAFASAWTIAGANLADGIQDNEWNGERLFQAGKFGTETQYQHLVFEEFARKVSPAIHLFGNTNIHLDPSITEEFANAVYRFGHSMLDENINRYQLQAAWLDASGQPTAVNTGTPNPLAGTPVMDATGHPVLNAIGLIDAFTNPLAYASRGANAAGEIALGSVNQVGNEIDEFVTGTLRSNLLGLPLDLAALNIARGRDVGVAPLNLLRNQIYTASQDTSVKPYANWNEFGQFLKHEASLINFVAAYGTHASILAATTVDAKRAAALDLVAAGNNEANHGVGGVKGDAYDFLHGLGAYAHITDPAALKLNPNALHDASGNIPFWSTGDVTGLDHVDLWIGGLAEKQNLFGGLLGSTFDFIFRSQMENLQDGDRLYYLPRLEGTHFGTEIEGNSFAEMIMHNTGAQHVTASVFLTPEYTVETAAVDPGNTATWTHNPATGKLLLDASWVLNADGTHTKGSDGADIKSIHFLGDDNFLGNTMVLGGTAHDDVLVAGNADDDTVYGDGGNDRIDGGNGNDFLYGGAGNDIITDTAGDDTIHGDAGDDTINAGIGDDIVFGGDGNDTIDGGKGIDDILGGLGNDIIRAGEGDDEVLGNEGNDWIEGGQGGDVLTGDVGAPTGQLPLYGADDVLIGGSYVATGANGHPVFDAANSQSNNGGDKMLAFSGDDIMIGGGGFNTFRGGKGFDWSSFEFDGQGISIDMNRKDFVLDAPPLSPDAIRDVFIETEGLSGSSYNDELIGSNDAKADTTNELTNINLIQNLDTFFSPNAPVHFNSGNIILGGGGSDRISGGGGDDIIDGDASLHVSLQNGQIVREILDGGRTGDVDSAVYSDIAANYAIGTATADGRGWDGLDAEGFFSVVHLTVGAGGGGVTKVTNDGADKLRNIERLEFSDGVHTVNEFVPTLPLKNQLPLGTITISGTPVIGNILTATAALTDLDAKAGLQTVTNTTYQWEYLDPARAQWVPITGAIAPTLKVADFEVGLPIRVVASFVDAKGFTESVVSAQTALVTTAPGVNTAPFIVPQQGQVGLPDTIVLDNVPVKLFLPVTTVFGDAQTPANALVYKVTLATGAALSTVGLTADLSGIATNGAILITGTLKAGVTGPFDIRVSATDGGPGTPLTVTDTFTVTVVHPSPGSLAVINGALQDGYIAGATVFMDSNGDGLHQSFEAQTITDVTGHFSLAGKPGALVAFGGPGAIDVATLLPFDGVYKAPAGSTVLTPLTTILSQGLEQGMALVDAHAALRTALQLNTGVDVTQIDPVAVMYDPDPVQKALAIHLFVTSTQILNTVALLQAASPNAAPLADITTLLLSGAVFDLTDPATVKSLVDLTGLFGPFADDAARIVLASNTLLAAKADPALSPLDILTQVTAVSVVAKGMTADALSTAFSLEDMDSVASHFSGALLAAEVADATHRIGDVNGDGVNDASHAAPAGHVALVDPVSSVQENTNVQGGLKIADIVVVDVGASGDVVSLAGADAASFAVRDGLLGKELWYVGANLDYEGGKTGYDVTVSVTNPVNPGAAPFTAAMTLSVLNVNEAPVAVADAYTTAEDQALTVSAADGLLKNDTDPDNVPGVHQEPMTATLVSTPSHGVLTLNADGSFVYTPNANFNSGYDPNTKQINPGPDSFTYTVSDGQLTSAPITVTLGVSPVDDLPTGSPGLAAALTGVTSATLTASAGTLADLDGIPATGPDAVAYAWAKSATGLGGWTAVAGTTAATLALSVPLGAGTPTYYEAVATYTDAGGTHTSVVSDTKAEIGTRFSDLLRDTVGTGAALQPISLLAGLSANDTYVVTHAGVTVMENVNGGTDTVETSLATYGLDANVENLSTISAAHGGSAAAVAYAWTGNALANTITTGAGDDRLDGGTGVDRMVGGLGNDTYVVDNIGDVVVEDPNAGTDTVVSAISYTLGANVENLTLTGIAPNAATGNAAGNVLTGNDGNNRLDGGAGADTMAGGLGNDTYVVDNAGDVVTEGANAGTDTVLSAVSFTLGANVENLTLTGLGDTTATGNDANNVLTGNAGNNLLDGRAGADRMVGGQGNDTYRVDDAGDVVVETLNGGTDTVLSTISYTLSGDVENLTLTGLGTLSGTGNGLANRLTGNDGDNRLDGRTGADTMAGGLGNDTYVVDNAGDVVVESAGAGTDEVVSSISYILGANLEKLTLSGVSNLTGTGNAADNVLTGNVGINLLDGGAGADTMAGGAGNDTYVVDNAGDVVIENAGAGTDTVRTSLISYTLGANVENLTYTGTGDFTGTGTATANVLTGGAGADILDGVRKTNGGFDTLVGGAGNDSYHVHNATDVVTEAVGGGTDTVEADVSFKLAANVENLTLVGTADINATGNTGNNIITGNTGANSMTGGTGSDIFVFGQNFGKDIVTDFTPGAAANHDTIDLSALTLALTGTTALQQFASFLSTYVSEVGAGATAHAQVKIGTDTIDMTGVHKTGLLVDDFRFH